MRKSYLCNTSAMKKHSLVGLVVLILLLAGGVTVYERLRNGRLTLPPEYYQSQPSLANAATFDHIVIIVEENKPRDEVIGSSSAPYINKLAKTYSQAVHYNAVTNPSLPNYISLTSGTTAGITNDCNPPGPACQADVTNVADSLEHAHKTWKTYAESMPKPCYGSNNGDYAVKHNPFMYYPDITSQADRCNSHVVPFSQFTADLSAATSLPDYALVSPNLCNDMHNCSIQTGDAWLARYVPQILLPRLLRNNTHYW